MKKNVTSVSNQFLTISIRKHWKNQWNYSLHCYSVLRLDSKIHNNSIWQSMHKLVTNSNPEHRVKMLNMRRKCCQHLLSYCTRTNIDMPNAYCLLCFPFTISRVWSIFGLDHIVDPLNNVISIVRWTYDKHYLRVSAMEITRKLMNRSHISATY